MLAALAPVARRSLADDLAVSVRRLIEGEGYGPGDRLPSIAEMARRFGVAPPTLREALRKLETLGLVDIRHGSGVYVRARGDALLLTNPVYAGTLTHQLLLDVLDARMAIELKAVALAAGRVSAAGLERLGVLLAESAGTVGDAVRLEANTLFHREIAAASGNAVLLQLLDVLSGLIDREQRVVLDASWRERFQREHEEILAALALREAERATACMSVHLESVRAAILLSNLNG